MDTPVTQLVYMSALAGNQDPSCIPDILKESVANNKAHHITGILLYINGSFLQVLEGLPKQVGDLYEKICTDPRHKHAVKVLEVEAPAREFSEWSMGYAAIEAQELDIVVGINDFFTTGHCLTELRHSAVLMILQKFRDGRWRRRLA